MGIIVTILIIVGLKWIYNKFIVWGYKVNAEQGDANAQAILGSMYYLGKKVEKDNTKAKKWLQKAARQGHVKAQISLDLINLEQFLEAIRLLATVAQHYIAEIELTHMLAQQGNVNAQFNLGMMYLTGQGVQQNYTSAIAWFLKASDQGHVKAKTMIGLMYGNGFGFEQDHLKAILWLEIAASQGDKDAIEILERINNLL